MKYYKLYSALLGAMGTVVTGIGTHGSWAEVLPAALGAFLVWLAPNSPAKPPAAKP